jgi:fluoride ion exporter CrcB/FEX
VETTLLLEQAEHLKAALNIAASVLLCLAATLLGLYAGRQL